MTIFNVLKRWLIWAVVIAAFVISLPTLLPQIAPQYLPDFVARLHVPFGIDLRGGSRLVVQLDKTEEEMRSSSALRDDVSKIIAQRLVTGGAIFSDYNLVAQERGQLRIEVPDLFDVSLLKDIVTIPAQLEIYLSFQGKIKADDVINGQASLPDNTLIFYDHSDDPPSAILVTATAILKSQDIRAITFVHAGGDFAHIDIDPIQNSIKHFVDRQQDDLVVVLDGEIIGRARADTTGIFTLAPMDVDFAKNLSVVLTSGALPVKVNILEERTIGADLGADFASAGVRAALGALIVVAIFMIVCYGMLGVIANIALVANLAILTSILSLSGLSLSLAGFAGLVLIVGVSVDGLILIYERMREERRHGKDLKIALAAGFSRAKHTIIDANVTTLLGALMLFLFGAGSISGFATIVAIGIIVSLFTNLVFAKILVWYWFDLFKPYDLPARLLRIVPSNTTIAFMRLRKFWLCIALGIMGLAGLLLSSIGLNYGIDFAGGALAVFSSQNNETHSPDDNLLDIVNRASELNIGKVTAQIAQDGTSILLTIPSQSMGEAADQSVALKLRGEFDSDYQLERMDIVGATIADQLTRVSQWAVFLSLAAIFLYVWWRFNWKFALCATLTTIHDVALLLLLFILMQWEFNLWSIAAMLAIIGYSLNDTIVVYDRIRAFTKQVLMTELVDLGINRTLSRTILTSLATLLAHIPLYYYGGADMRNFAAVLLIGIFIGTASSIFIAGPLLAMLESFNRKIRGAGLGIETS